MKQFSSKRRALGAAVVILLALFLLRPGVSRLKSRIASSISWGVGRPVEIGAVHLRLLPRPGFDLDDVVVYDDPAFGMEPMLRASEVTADLRLISLVRGRLEIARLDLTEPSLNLVHGENGRWNLEALLERTAHTPLAPTAKAKSEPRPGFPYIEASSARINFKNGPEKKAFALSNADFSLWQESENTWGVRLKAQPVRTDLNLNDTGLLQVSGTWQRASSLRDTPLQFSLEWNRAQLGQLTKLLTGNDQGWRGGIQLDVMLVGTPGRLRIVGDAAIQDFRRYDITRGEALRLAAHCEAEYSSNNHAFHAIVCSAPVGSGLIALKGDMGLPGSRSYDLVLTAEKVPASAAAALVVHSKSDLPDDLKTEGTMRGSLSIEERPSTEAKLRLEGVGQIAGLHLSSAANKAEIGPEMVPLLITSGVASESGVRRGVMLPQGSQKMHAPDGPRVEFGPFSIGAGHAATPTVRGWANRTGYGFSVQGEADVARVLRLARMFSLPGLHSTAEGSAQLDLQIAGSWRAPNNGNGSGFLGPQVTGRAKLQNVRIVVHGTSGPLELVAADLHLSRDELHVQKLSARAAGSAWTGALEMPRGCGTPSACEVHFALNANQIALGELSSWASPPPKKRPWYRVLEAGSPAGPSFLASVRATGQLTTERLQLRGLEATHVSARVSIDAGKVEVSELKADFLGGKHRGEWQADFSVKPAVCEGSGSLTEVSLPRLANAMTDEWIEGTANASYEVEGACSSDFWKSSEGRLQFEMKEGSLPHVSLADDAEPLKFLWFTGEAQLQAGKLQITGAKLDSPEGMFQLSGTASLGRELDFKLARTSHAAEAAAYAISGTLAEPSVAPLPGTEQAKLKTETAK